MPTALPTSQTVLRGTRRGTANKELVAEYVNRASAGDIDGAAALRSSGYADHTPDTQRSGTSLGATRIFGCGNFVAVLRTGVAGPDIGRSCDLYRVTNRRVADHWGAVEATASPSWTAGGGVESASPAAHLPSWRPAPAVTDSRDGWP